MKHHGKRQVDWSRAVRELREDRAPRPAIREERPHAFGVIDGSPIKLAAWRGLSGRRHVVRVLPFAPSALDDVRDGLVIAVRRDDRGLAHIVTIGGDTLRPSWWAKARSGGANELHVHRLAESAGERAAVMMDLTA